MLVTQGGSPPIRLIVRLTQKLSKKGLFSNVSGKRRQIAAKRFLCQIITGSLKRSRPAAVEYLSISAFPFEVIIISKGFEHLGIAGRSELLIFLLMLS
jgi:hypothetical protein